MGCVQTLLNAGKGKRARTLILTYTRLRNPPAVYMRKSAKVVHLPSVKKETSPFSTALPRAPRPTPAGRVAPPRLPGAATAWAARQYKRAVQNMTLRHLPTLQCLTACRSRAAWPLHSRSSSAGYGHAGPVARTRNADIRLCCSLLVSWSSCVAVSCRVVSCRVVPRFVPCRKCRVVPVRTQQQQPHCAAGTAGQVIKPGGASPSPH